MTLLVTADHVPGTDISLTVPYAAEGPGPSYDTLGDYNGQPVVHIEGAELDKTNGQLNMTTVVVRSGMTMAQAIQRWVTTDDTFVPIEQVFPPNMSEDEVKEKNQQAFSTSESAATLAAMNHLKQPMEVRVVEVLEDAAAKDILAQNDVILQVDDKNIGKPSDVREYVQSKKPGDIITVKFRHTSTEPNGEEKSEEKTERITLGAQPHQDNVALLGVTMEAKPTNGVEVDYHLEDIGGPSAGLMFSMAVVDKLSPGELTGGKFVAGTGTISEDGTVGPIGGIEHKVRAAKDLGANVFLAPEENCQEAVSRDTGDMTVLKVKSLDDAITQLDAYNSGGEYATCKN